MYCDTLASKSITIVMILPLCKFRVTGIKIGLGWKCMHRHAQPPNPYPTLHPPTPWQKFLKLSLRPSRENFCTHAVVLLLH